MSRARKWGMRIWKNIAAQCALVAVTSFACTEKEGGIPSSNASGAGGGVACTEPASDSDAPQTLPHSELGFDFDDGLTHEGHISNVTADRVHVTTPAGTFAFSWRGPALDMAFAVDDAVQLVGAYGIGYQVRTRISTLRSSSATAVAVAGSPWIVLGTHPGSNATLEALPPELPHLAYGLVSCCAGFDPAPSTRCDYSALEATLEGSTTAIPLGATGVIDGWSVTNLRSTYVVRFENSWDIQVTLLGPATPRGLDGGR